MLRDIAIYRRGAGDADGVRLPGNVVVRPYLTVCPAILSARCAGARRAGTRYTVVVRAPVMLAARCAGVVRALVVRTARRAQPDLVRAVVRIVARCAAHDCLRSVVPMAGSSCRVVRCRCGTLLRIAIVSLAGSPNTPLQRTRVAPRDQADFRM